MLLMLMEFNVKILIYLLEFNYQLMMIYMKQVKFKNM